MEEKFIERGTDYPIRNGKLSLYETNCACKDIKFYFEQFVLTIMLEGHKTIISDNLKFEFFPGTFFIPERQVINNVSIPNASLNNPTKCLVLELDPMFVQSFYEELRYSKSDKNLIHQQAPEETQHYFLSNDRLLLKAFSRLYDIQFKDRSQCKELVEELIIKEMLLRLFNTEAVHLLKMNFEQSIEDNSIRKVITYIQNNINLKLTTSNLAKVAGLGQTTFFKKFKQTTGQSPIEYIVQERIKQAKIMIKKDKLHLQEIAYKCGFNSYEYFCSSFKKIENLKPSEFKRAKIQA